MKTSANTSISCLVFVFLGCRNPDVDAVYPQHSGYYTVDESVLKNGAALAAQYAIDFLAE